MAERRAVVFAPYLHTLGGGERVIVRIAQLLSEGYSVRVGAPRPVDDRRWSVLGFPAGLDIEVMNAREFTRGTVRADLAVSMSNHLSLPSFAKRSLLIVQFPSDELSSLGVLKRLAARWSLRRFDLITYSQYCAEHIARRWSGAEAEVVAPPVRLRPMDPARKTNTILSVGRFATSGNHKRQDAMLEAWRQLKPLIPGWQLVLVGAGSTDVSYTKSIVDEAAEIGDVIVHLDASPDVIDDCFASASIYWHAAGFGRPTGDPGAAEHFGMSTVEAMSAGAVPVVYADGGQVELVPPEIGYTWRTIDELVATTSDLVESPSRMALLSAAANAEADRYSEVAFDAWVRRYAGLTTGRAGTPA